MSSTIVDLMARAWGVWIGLMVLSAATALGRIALQVLLPKVVDQPAPAPKTMDVWVNLFLAIAIGYSLIAWMAIVLTMLGFGHPKVLLGGLLPLSLGGVAIWIRQIYQLKPDPLTVVQRVLTRHAVLIVFALASTAPALCLPEAWDALVYHLQLPRRWLASSGLAVFYDLPYSALPSMVEVNAWCTAALDMYLAPQIVLGLFWCLAMAMFYANLRLFTSYWIATLLTLTCFSAETVLLMASGGYVEPVVMFNALLIVYLVQQGTSRRAVFPWRMAIVIGLLVGGCGATKTTALAMLLPASLLWLCPLAGGAADCSPRTGSRCPERRGAEPSDGQVGRRFLMAWALMCLVAGLHLLPFYARTWWATGNPFFPYWDQWFSQDPARLESSAFHHDIGGKRYGVPGLLGSVMGPMLMSSYQSVYDGTFGWQSLLFLIVAALRLPSVVWHAKDWRTIWLAQSTLVLFIVWAATAQQARFAIVGELCLALCAARLMMGLRPHLQTMLVGLSVGLASVSVPWPAAQYYLNAWLANIGWASERVILEQATGSDYLDLAEAIEDHTPTDSRVLLLLEHRGFYLPREQVIGTPFFQSQFFTPPENFATAEKVLEVLQRERITHLVVATRPLGPDIPEHWAARLPILQQAIEQAATAGRLRAIWVCDTYQLLEVVW